MNTCVSKTMEAQLQTIPVGSALCRTYCSASDSWTETPLSSAVSAHDQLLVLRYAIYPGVQVSYNYFHTDTFSHQHPHMPNIMEINHCRHGRMGWQMEHNLNLFLGEGDLSLHRKDCCSKSTLSLPLGFYEGISFSIDFQTLQKNPPQILKDINIDYEKIQSTFCDTAKITALSSSFAIDCIFQGLYDLPASFVIPYCKIKIPEFILFLSRLSLQDTNLLEPFDTQQIKIVKDIHEFLTTNIPHRYTIEYLSKQYLMNTSTLKSTFKAVYGAPIATYMKQYRMNQAIAYLRDTELSMAEIASAVGYENQSKFTNAFKNVVGVLPTTYRKNYH